ncbi:MAG: hypothetical protein ACE5EN_04845 [Nitrospinota bacterium]
MELKPLHKAFRTIYKGIPRELFTEIGIGLPTISKVKQDTKVENPVFTQFQGIWDTGATGTVITEKVVNALNLKQIGVKKVIGVNSEDIVPTYLVNIYLPNKVFFLPLRLQLVKLVNDMTCWLGWILL